MPFGLATPSSKPSYQAYFQNLQALRFKPAPFPFRHHATKYLASSLTFALSDFVRLYWRKAWLRARPVLHFSLRDSALGDKRLSPRDGIRSGPVSAHRRRASGKNIAGRGKQAGPVPAPARSLTTENNESLPEQCSGYWRIPHRERDTLGHCLYNRGFA